MIKSESSNYKMNDAMPSTEGDNLTEFSVRSYKIDIPPVVDLYSNFPSTLAESQLLYISNQTTPNTEQHTEYPTQRLREM